MKKPWIFLFILTGMIPILCADNPDVLNRLESVVMDGLEISNSLIRIDTRVRDKTGNPVRGLKAEDFRIYQDGRLQTIAEFHEISPENRGTEPRIIVFIFDDIRLPREKYGQVQTAIIHFADHVMQPADIVGLARTAGGGMVFQPLTSDAAELKTAVDQWQGSVGPIRPEAAFQSINPMPVAVFITQCSGPGCAAIGSTIPIFVPSPIQIFNPSPDMSYLNAVVRIVNDLIALPHRKSVILFSDNDPDMKQMEMRLSDQMIRGSAILYQCGLPGWRRKWSNVAEDTGGYAVKAKEDSFREIEQVLDDYGHCYLLGYEPDAETLDMYHKSSGATESSTTVTVHASASSQKHSLKIKMNDRDMKARTRSGFSNSLLGPKTDPVPPENSDNFYRNLLGSSPFISGNLNVTGEAVSFIDQLRRNIINTTLHVDERDLVFGSGSEDGYRNAEVEVAGILATDRIVKRHAGQARFGTPVRDFEEHRQRSFDTSFEIQAPVPGLYSLIASVRQRREGRIGNVSILVEVPDIRRSELAVSGIATYAQSENSDSGSSGYPISRKFRRSDPFVCYFQVYNARRDKSGGRTRMESQYRFYRDNTLVKASEVLAVPDSGANAASNIKAVTLDINPGEELPAGDYLLEILVVDHLADKKTNTITRSVAIELIE